MSARWPASAEVEVQAERPLRVSCAVLVLGTPTAAGVWIRFGVAWGLVAVLAVLLALAVLRVVELTALRLGTVLDDVLAEVDDARDADRMVVLSSREFAALMRAGPGR